MPRTPPTHLDTPPLPHPKSPHATHPSTPTTTPRYTPIALLTTLLTTISTLTICTLTTTAAAAPNNSPDSLLSRPIALIVALALVSLAPFVFMSLTAFLKISTVLHIVRGAIGAQNVPSNTVVMALAAALALIAMAPVGSKIMDRATPVLADPASADTAVLVSGIVDATKEPIRSFLDANSSLREKNRFYEVAKGSRPAEEHDDISRTDLIILIPAFMVTELMEAFALGFLIYLPFLIIDLVVANVLLSLGMQMLSPTQVSLPFKLLLFVAIDGWGLLARSLVSGYATG